MSVLAPTPAVTTYANDKVELSRAVDALLGSRYQVETRVARGAEGLAEDIAVLAKRHSVVAFKMARCASAIVS